MSVRWGALGLALGLVAACTGGDGVPGHRVTASAVDLRPPGTALPDGLTVPTGTRLAGTSVPTPDGWRALLVIDGDPLRAWDELAAAANRAGFRHAGAAQASCWATEGAKTGIACATSGTTEEGERLAMALRHGAVRGAINEARFATPLDRVRPGWVGAIDLLVFTGTSADPEPEAPPRPSVRGALLRPPERNDPIDVLEIDGARPVAVAFGASCLVGMTGVWRITGDPRAVESAARRRIDDLGAADAAGGWHVEVHRSADADTPRYLLVAGCHDL